VRLGPYEVVSLRGKGGMGEVYRGRDVRLDREVAIKVLPRELAEDPLLRERLRREARTISQLRHPHICTLYDVGSERGVDYLVMEYLEGETLEDRLSRGALPLDQAIAIGGQIAEAVAAAHGAGVIHRDLKPGNVMLTLDGAKVLDFGLAKGQEARAASGGAEAPTVTEPLTSAGSLVGTLLYMAPEQLEGKGADQRSDVWALGAMLYQMVTGTKPFQGGSHANVMAAILTAQPRSVSELQASTPARLEWLIERCLEKNPERRWQSARDLALELGSLAEVSESPLPGASGRSRRRSIALALGAGIGTLVGLGIGALLGLRTGDEGRGPELESWTASLLDSTDAVSSPFHVFALSPDGRTLVVGKHEAAGGTVFYRRALDSLDRTPLPATAVDTGFNPFSPDSRQLAVVDSRHRLRTMPLDGEPESLLAENVGAPTLWGEDGYIYYMGSGSWPPTNWRVRATGGDPEPMEAGFATDLLPGGRILLTTLWSGSDLVGTVRAVDIQTGESRVLTTGNFATYIDPGFLFFCREGEVWAAPIDVATGELVKAPRLIEEVGADPSPIEGCQAITSRSGDLIYVTRRETGLSRLVWVSRDGTVEPVASEIKNFSLPIPSLDGRLVSAQVATAEGSEQWILDLETGSWSRPAQSGQTSVAMWVPPEGREILFASDRDGLNRAFIQPADRSAPPKPLWPGDRANTFLGVSADGRKVILVAFDAPGFFVLDHDSGEVRNVVEEGVVYCAQFHPDGDWITYARREADHVSNVWLVPFPGPGEPRQITFDGGEEPQWSVAGDEIYYRGPTHFWSMPIEKSGGGLVTGRARPLFEDGFRHFDPRGFANYSQHPNGRFLMIENVEDRESSLVLVENWRAKVAQAFARRDG
jgi:serine/threonine protein kinase